MKRFLFWFFILLGTLSLLFFSLNLFDSRSAPGLAAPPLPEAGLEAGNGFYLLWGFAEGAETDLLTESFRVHVQELFNPPGKNQFSHSRYGHWLTRLNAAYRENWHGTNLYFPQLPGDDVCAFFAARRAMIGEQQQRCAVPLQRYRQVLRAEALEDFTPLGREFPARSVLLATHTARLFAASRALDALAGDWQSAGDDLFAAMATGLKLVGSGRTLAVNSLGKILVELSLRTLGSLLNRSDCPPAVARSIMERLPARPAAAFGTKTARTFAWMSFARALERVKEDKVVDPFLLKDYFREPAGFFALERFVAISGPRFFWTVHALAAFLLKKNESVAAMRAFWDGVGRLEETPPASWGPGPRPASRLGAGLEPGPFWWLRNPLGKMMVRSAVPFTWPVLQNYVYRSHGLKVRYDLTRLLAAARLQAGPGMVLPEATLRNLLASAEERDPFSNRPYLFNLASGMLYSVGPDGTDNHGLEQPAALTDSDIAVRISFVKRL
jgi:hypothetical protein